MFEEHTFGDCVTNCVTVLDFVVLFDFRQKVTGCLKMIQFTLILIGTIGVLSTVPACSAINENMTIEEIHEMAQNIVNATNKWQTELKDYPIDGRKSKLLPFGGLLPFHALCKYPKKGQFFCVIKTRKTFRFGKLGSIETSYLPCNRILIIQIADFENEYRTVHMTSVMLNRDGWCFLFILIDVILAPSCE